MNRTSVVSRNKTVKGGPKEKTSRLGDELRQLYPDDSKSKGNVDIVFVPGLNAHPEECWKWTEGGPDRAFNWVVDQEGLHKEFPDARILLYQYESAWKGQFRVKQHLDSIANTLLKCLNIKRKGDQTRPIVLIGHSMGGLVIAEALKTAEYRKESYPKIFEAISGCMFFGTPFKGAQAASIAAMYAGICNIFDDTMSSELLDMMKPGNKPLEDLTSEFVRIAYKLKPEIKLYCFYERHSTDFLKNIWPDVSKFCPNVIKNAILNSMVARIVEEGSAVLPMIDNQCREGLDRDHRGMVKFEDNKHHRYQFVVEQIRSFVDNARRHVEKRFRSTRAVDEEVLKDIKKQLEGTHVSRKLDLLSKTAKPSVWLPDNEQYLNWVGCSSELDQCLWIKGRHGRGKTNATIAVLETIRAKIAPERDPQFSGRRSMLAYFFCERNADCSTAEDVLKSLIYQLIDEESSLATNAEKLAKDKDKDKSRDPQKKIHQSLTVDNLWQILQDILADDLVGAVYLVVNNLHVLPEKSSSTSRLLELIKYKIQEQGGRREGPGPRWFITSRAARPFRSRLIDLDDPKYDDRVRVELEKHADDKVDVLGKSKGYSRELSFFAKSHLGRRAQNSQWIDLVCAQLNTYSREENQLQIRRFLRDSPEELDTLLGNVWQGIFDRQSKSENLEDIKELLRALILTFDDPSIEVLAMLTSHGNDAEVRRLVEDCSPLLVTKQLRNESTGRKATQVSFMNSMVKKHLQENAAKLLNLTDEEVKVQHGILSLTCLSCLKKSLGDLKVGPSVVNAGAPAVDVKILTESTGKAAEQSDVRSSKDSNGDEDEDQDDDENESDEDDEDDEDDESGLDDEEEDYWESDEEDYWESDEASDEELTSRKKSLDDKPTNRPTVIYAVNHWLTHARKATPRIVEDLSKDEFWKDDSLVRRHWLAEYMKNKGLFSDFTDSDKFKTETLNSLHITAALGFDQLVAALLRNGQSGKRDDIDSIYNSPLHYAAWFGCLDTVDVLLKAGAPVDSALDLRQKSPLHMAAFPGKIDVLKKLIRHKANVNGIAMDIGPVINAAISSGSFEAVKLLVDEGAVVDYDLEDHDEEDQDKQNNDSQDQDPRGQSEQKQTEQNQGGQNQEEDGNLAIAPLRMASVRDSPIFELIFNKAKDEDLSDGHFIMALQASAAGGQRENFARLIERSYDQEYWQGALDIASEKGNWEIVRDLLDKAPRGLSCEGSLKFVVRSPIIQDEALRSILKYQEGRFSAEVLDESLYEATDREKESTVGILLDQFGANPNVSKEEWDYTNALTAAAWDGTTRIVEILLQHNAEVNSPAGWALQAAALNGHQSVVELLLSKGADPSATTTNKLCPSGTALQAASDCGQREIVQMLLAHRANPDLGAGTNTYPIIAAAKFGYAEILKMLVDAGAKVDNIYGGFDKSTPLINTVMYLPLKSIKLILDAGADINLPDNDGDTSLIVAARRGDIKILQYLLDKGADIMRINNSNESAIDAAIEYEYYDCLRELIRPLWGMASPNSINATTPIRSTANNFIPTSSPQPISRIIEEEKAPHITDSPQTSDVQPRRTTLEERPFSASYDTPGFMPLAPIQAAGPMFDHNLQNPAASSSAAPIMYWNGHQSQAPGQMYQSQVQTSTTQYLSRQQSTEAYQYGSPPDSGYQTSEVGSPPLPHHQQSLPLSLKSAYDSGYSTQGPVDLPDPMWMDGQRRATQPEIPYQVQSQRAPHHQQDRPQREKHNGSPSALQRNNQRRQGRNSLPQAVRNGSPNGGNKWWR